VLYVSEIEKGVLAAKVTGFGADTGPELPASTTPPAPLPGEPIVGRTVNLCIFGNSPNTQVTLWREGIQYSAGNKDGTWHYQGDDDEKVAGGITGEPTPGELESVKTGAEKRADARGDAKK